MQERAHQQKGMQWMDFLLQYKTFIILAILSAIAAIVSPHFLTSRNLMNVIRQISASAVLGAGFTCVIASGNIDLSVGTMLGLLGVIMALVSKTQVPFVLVLAIGAVCGMLFGALNGTIGVKLKLPLFIVTLATGQIYRGACNLLSNTSPISGLPDVFKTIGQGFWLGIPIPVYIMLGVTAGIYVLINRTAFGRRVLATGGNKEAARTSGINVNAVTISVYVIMGLCAMVAALIMTGRAASAQPAAGQGMEMDAIAAVVIGGTAMGGGSGKVLGTVLGCLIVGIINNILNLATVDSNWQYIAKGILIIVAVAIDVLSATYFTNRLKRLGR